MNRFHPCHLVSFTQLYYLNVIHFIPFNFIENINFIKLHPCDKLSYTMNLIASTSWIWFHPSNSFSFYVSFVCSISCIWSISWIPWIWRVWCMLFGEFYPIHHFHLFHGIHPNLWWWNGPISSKCTNFHSHGSNLLNDCHQFKICTDQFPFIHVCSILSNFLSSMWCSFEIK